MKKLFQEAPDVSQRVANRSIKIIERHLRLHKVDRAKDLPEEAKVRLLCDLRSFFDSEAGKGEHGSAKGGFWSKLRDKIENFMGFHAANGKNQVSDMVDWIGSSAFSF